MLNLNEKQEKARKNLLNYINGTADKFLLLGMAGSGKTTVIVNTFNTTKLHIAFCAFTNKATQVLSKISQKFDLKFLAEFMTIHQLLALELKYGSSETDIDFKFKIEKAVSNMHSFDVIIFDECSTISTELYGYLIKTQEFILEKMGKTIKYIFVGDYWQLPPVNEKSAVAFDSATKYKWPISKLEVIMRSNNTTIRDINLNMLSWIPRFKAKDAYDFVDDYPYNLVERGSGSYLHISDMMYQYIDTWHNKTPDCVILTCSRKNCIKINLDIQNILNTRRNISDVYKYPTYSAGDRITLIRPIMLYGMKEEDGITTLTSQLQITLYNGEIFDVVSSEQIKVKTELNKYEFNKPHFDAHKLKIKRINTDTTYEIIYIPDVYVDEARDLLKRNLYWREFLDVMSEFIKRFPKLDYGYCLTVYKSQGSEWDTVFVNLNNLKWCIVGGETDVSLSKKIQLFKITYTAVSRASNEIYCSW